jgi:hypothetical protein
MMLGVPSQIAGCSLRVLVSPPPIAPAILVVASLLGIAEVHEIGGAQAIGALAFGTERVSKVDKIFGPGNAWVTEAKLQASLDPHGAAYDLPAGPSEVIAFECSLRASDCLCAPECRATDCLGWPLIALFAGPSQHHHEVCLLILKHTRLEVPGPESRLAQILLRQGRDKIDWLDDLREVQDALRRAPGAVSISTLAKIVPMQPDTWNAKKKALLSSLEASESDLPAATA